MSKSETVSQNIGDVQGNNKRKIIFSTVCNSKEDIILLQETYNTDGDFILWKITGQDVLSSH